MLRQLFPDTKGVVTIDSIDSNLSLSYGVLDAKIATRNHAGVVKPGDNIILNNDGEISVAVAQLNTKGLMKVTDASRLSLGADGAIDAKTATTTASGVVTLTDTITDGDTTHVPTANAVYDAITGQTPPQIADATRNSKGIVQIGDNLEVSSGLISVPQASRLARGVVKVGSNLTVDSTDGTINVPTGSSSQSGILQVGSNLTDTNGVVDVPTATDSTKGILSVDDTNGLTISSGVLGVQPATHGQWGVAKIGSNLNVDQYGVVDLAPADTSNLGGVKVGDNLNVNSAGLLSVPDATSSSKGVIRAGSNLTVANGVLSVPYADSSTYGVVNITTSITSGSSAVPTSGAVYDAVSGMGGISQVTVNDIITANPDLNGFSTNPNNFTVSFSTSLVNYTLEATGGILSQNSRFTLKINLDSITIDLSKCILIPNALYIYTAATSYYPGHFIGASFNTLQKQLFISGIFSGALENQDKLRFSFSLYK